MLTEGASQSPLLHGISSLADPVTTGTASTSVVTAVAAKAGIRLGGLVPAARFAAFGVGVYNAFRPAGDKVANHFFGPEVATSETIAAAQPAPLLLSARIRQAGYVANGYDAEIIFRSWLRRKGVSLQPKARGNEGGPDAVYTGGKNLGWSWAELKPDHRYGQKKGLAQIRGRYKSGYTGSSMLYLWKFVNGAYAFRAWKSDTDIRNPR